MSSNRSKPCEWCSTPTTIRCSGCNEIHICSKACMKLMWKEHKRTCRKKKTDTVTAIASVTATATATDALVEQWLV